MPFRHKQLALAVLVLVAGPPDRLAAQVTWAARLGATYTSTMVTDQIAGSVIKLRPGITPTLMVQGDHPLRTRSPLWVSGELQFNLGELQRHENGTTTDVAGLRAITVTGGLRGHFAGPVSWRMAGGFITYAASEKAGIFTDGAPTRLLGTAALDLRRPLREGSRLVLSYTLRYDAHGFTTKQLENNGYTGFQTVHRVTFGVGVVR